MICRQDRVRPPDPGCRYGYVADDAGGNSTSLPVYWRPALVSPDLANLAAAVDSGLAVALLPASSVLNPSRVRPLDAQVLPGDHMLSINLIHASTLTPGALAALAGCMADTLRSSNS